MFFTAGTSLAMNNITVKDLQNFRSFVYSSFTKFSVSLEDSNIKINKLPTVKTTFFSFIYMYYGANLYLSSNTFKYCGESQSSLFNLYKVWIVEDYFSTY